MTDVFSPLMADGTPRVCIGVHRLPFPDVLKAFRRSGGLFESSYSTIYTTQGMRDAYDRGEFGNCPFTVEAGG